MPGPLSTPMYWNENRRNESDRHGYNDKDDTRKSGKTARDHASGKWQATASNKARRSAENRKAQGK